MAKRLLIVTAVAKERDAIASAIGGDARVTVSGLGRVNAACATTEALLRDEFDFVISAGVAGALPMNGGREASLAIGEAIVAERCIYAEEGLMTPNGFCDMRGLGFPLGDFEGNEVPVDEHALAALRGSFRGRIGRIATVATCSGADHAAAEVARRTGAIAEAMEGAAVVHAALRLGIPGLEVRTISNTTGDRGKQHWDLPLALERLGVAMAQVVQAI